MFAYAGCAVVAAQCPVPISSRIVLRWLSQAPVSRFGFGAWKAPRLPIIDSQRRGANTSAAHKKTELNVGAIDTGIGRIALHKALRTAAKDVISSFEVFTEQWSSRVTLLRDSYLRPIRWPL